MVQSERSIADGLYTVGAPAFDGQDLNDVATIGSTPGTVHYHSRYDRSGWLSSSSDGFNDDSEPPMIETLSYINHIITIARYHRLWAEKLPSFPGKVFNVTTCLFEKPLAF
jgi:hypothetical protein